MNITAMKAEARALAAAVEAGTASDEQVAELASLVEKIEARQAAADLAAKAVAAAAEAPVAETTNETRSIASNFAGYNGRGTSSKVEVSTRAAITTNDLVIEPTKVSVPTPGFQAPLTSLVTRVPVSTNAVEYVVTDVTYGADWVDEGDEKPETTFTFTPMGTTLDTIASWAAATRQALEDEAQLESIITNELNSGLARKIESHIADVITGATSVNTASGASLLAAIRNGIAACEADGYTPTVVVVNPADWAALDLEVLGATVNGPVRGANFFGLTAVSSNSVDAGTAFVGDFAAAVRLFDRGTAAVYITDSHEGNFTKNVVNILAETRVTAAVVAPKAICSVTVDEV